MFPMIPKTVLSSDISHFQVRLGAEVLLSQWAKVDKLPYLFYRLLIDM